MVAETGVMIGLVGLVYLVSKLAKDFEDADTDMNRGLFSLSILFVIGLEYAGYGIAKANGLSNAEDAYLVALLITTVAFIGFLIKIVGLYREENQEESGMNGLSS